MNFPANIQTSITPKKAQQVLADNGMRVSLEQAESILKILLIFAQSTPHAKNSRPLHKSKHR